MRLAKQQHSWLGSLFNRNPDVVVVDDPRNAILNRKLWILLLLAVLAIGFYLSIGVTDWGFALPRRGRKVLAMVLVGFSVSYSTVIFQTITNNRILTPAIIGFNSMYVLIQTALTFFLGSLAIATFDPNLMFAINVGCMIIFAGALYRWLFEREGTNLYFLVLVGVVFGTLFGNLSSFMQNMLDPNEFQVLQDRLFASIQNVDEDLLLISCIGIFWATAYSFRFAPYLDVISLGRDVAINLGIDHTVVVNRLMIVIAVLVSVSTALVGPILFFGLLAANVTYQFMGTYRHGYLIPAAMLMSVIALVGGQLLLERVFEFNTTIGVIINFVGGVYFLYLLLKEARG
ncbi:MAG: iron chelate uptake ABC transporter family permease subunit [Chloroflexota bacterium]